MKPLIGITCSEEADGSRVYLNGNYVEAITAAGGLPLLLPALEDLTADFFETVDGIVFSGGDDVDPVYFDEEPRPGLGAIYPGRDAFEIKLARTAMAARKPVLGICRGFQVLNIAAGGAAYQDFAALPGTHLKHVQQAPRWYPTHSIKIETESHLAKALGTTAVRVNSFHHQAVSRLAPEFIVTARASDGVIEAVESGQGFILGVQFHPEEMWRRDEKFLNIFKLLVDAARKP